MHFINKACNTLYLFYCVGINFDVVLSSCTIFQTLCTQYPCHCLWPHLKTALPILEKMWFWSVLLEGCK